MSRDGLKLPISLSIIAPVSENGTVHCQPDLNGISRLRGHVCFLSFLGSQSHDIAHQLVLNKAWGESLAQPVDDP